MSSRSTLAPEILFADQQQISHHHHHRFHHLIANIISLTIYIWVVSCLIEVKRSITSAATTSSSTALIWMHMPWIIFGMVTQLFGIIAFLIRPNSPSSTPPDSSNIAFQERQQQELTAVRVWLQSEKTLMWLQMDVGYGLIATSHWIMVNESPARMIFTIFIFTTVPIIVLASQRYEDAVSWTQLASLFHLMASLHSNALALNFWGLLSTFCMLIYLGLVSVPLMLILAKDEIHISSCKIPFDYVVTVCPAVLSRFFLLGLVDLSQFSSILQATSFQVQDRRKD